MLNCAIIFIVSNYIRVNEFLEFCGEIEWERETDHQRRKLAIRWSKTNEEWTRERRHRKISIMSVILSRTSFMYTTFWEFSEKVKWQSGGVEREIGNENAKSLWKILTCEAYCEIIILLLSSNNAKLIMCACCTAAAA